jgi:pteridine reductase
MTEPKRVALVTGAGTRVGAAVARALGAARMRVAVHYHGSAEGAHATCDAIRAAGGEASAHRADLYDHEAARRLVREVIDHHGDLDLLVPSAANFERVPFEDVTEAELRRAFSLNLEAPLFMAREASASLRRTRGSIVFITDSDLERPTRNYLPYLLSKAAVRMLMRTLAVELAPDVRVNAVAPGTVLPPASTSPQALDELVGQIPLGRIGSAEDVAEAVLYLANAPFVTGHELVVDGGHRVGA